jgi:imidazolonepropionase
MAAAGTVAVLLPGTAFNLGLDFPDARRFLSAGVPVALSTDFNPGSCYCPSMPFILSTASSRCGMTVEQAITAATVNAAASAGLPGKGRLCPGCDADFVVWDLDDYRGIPYHLAAPDIRSVHLRAREARTAGG